MPYSLADNPDPSNLGRLTRYPPSLLPPPPPGLPGQPPDSQFAPVPFGQPQNQFQPMPFGNTGGSMGTNPMQQSLLQPPQTRLPTFNSVAQAPPLFQPQAATANAPLQQQPPPWLRAMRGIRPMAMARQKNLSPY